MVKEFAVHLKDDYVTIWGHTVPISPSIISTIFGIPNVGEVLIPRKEALDDVLDAFHHLTKPREIKFKSKGQDQGINQVSLPEP